MLQPRILFVRGEILAPAHSCVQASIEHHPLRPGRDGAARRPFTTMRIMPMSDGTPDGDLCAYAASGNLDGMLGAIQRGADVHYRRRLGAHYHIRTVSSPILYAVKNRELAAARFLLDRGVSTETRERNGGTLLIETASRPHQSDAIPMARLLLRHGAHVEAKNRAGFTAIQTAMTTPFGDVCVEMAKLLKVHGASTTGLLAKVQEARTRYESEYFPDDEESERADRGKRWRAIFLMRGVRRRPLAIRGRDREWHARGRDRRAPARSH